MPGKILFSRVLQNRAANPSNNQQSNRDAESLPQAKAHVMGDYHDDYAPRASQYGQRDHQRYDNRGERGNRGDDRGEGNKIRRGPGRRLAKEKQKLRSSMDPALLQKYNSLSPALQEKINATIEICYQQHMASVYRQGEQGATSQASYDEEDHYDMDVEVDAEPPSP